MQEEWKKVKEGGEVYEISSLGCFRSVERVIVTKNQFGTCKKRMKSHLHKPGLSMKGYRTVSIAGKSRKVARLVALAFIENPDGKPQVNHKDGNKENDRADNLEWVTNGENQKHAWRTGLNNGVRGMTWKKKKP